uniref:Uncharacterized protein n=1 Tax=Arundo donax TaxID=35708 RepID=A0A0A9DTV8_ARUDO
MKMYVYYHTKIATATCYTLQLSDLCTQPRLNAAPHRSYGNSLSSSFTLNGSRWQPEQYKFHILKYDISRFRTHRTVSNNGQVKRTSLSLLVSACSFTGFVASSTALSSYSFVLLTIISSPSPVARQREPATLVAIFSSGSMIMGKPAHRMSVPVVCALRRGVSRNKLANSLHRICSCFMATSVNMTWSGRTPLAAACAFTLISPAAGNLKSHKVLFGTRLRILHLKIVHQN